MVADLQAQGYRRADRKYLVFVDTTSANICGLGSHWPDDRPEAANTSNTETGYARVDAGCWGTAVAAHELMHTFGGVQNSAPHTTGQGHCTDEWDQMCYDDGSGKPMRVACSGGAGSGHDLRFDCKHDDYFHTNPPAGSYLATH